MAFRTHEPELLIIKDKTFCFQRDKDFFDIEKNVVTFKKIIDKQSGIVGIISKFGSGKTFFLQYLHWLYIQDLYKNEGSKVYPGYIDISKYENSNNLLSDIFLEVLKNLSYIHNIENLNFDAYRKARNSLRKAINSIKKLLPVLSKYGIRFISNKIGNDISELVDASGEISKSLSEYLIESMDEEANLQQRLEKLGKESPMIIMIDNLDRCRPEFVLDFFVLTKRVLNVENILFVVSYDKHQIINLLRTLYGNDVDVSSYLRKYIGFEFYLPQSNNLNEFIKTTINDDKYINYLDDDDTLNCKGEISNLNVKYLILSLWTEVYTKTNLSLRQFQHGVVLINKFEYKEDSSINIDIKKHVLFVLFLYLKIVYPYEYQNLYYYLSWGGEFDDKEEVNTVLNPLEVKKFNLDFKNTIKAIDICNVLTSNQADDNGNTDIDLAFVIFSSDVKYMSVLSALEGHAEVYNNNMGAQNDYPSV